MQNPIKRYGAKNTDQYKYYSSDFAKRRFRHWFSIFLQSHPIIRKEDVHSVLEFGGGRDTTRALSHHMGIEHYDVDVSDRFFPDYQASILDYAFEGQQYDLVCSFECLEHNPYKDLDKLIPHMLQFSKRYFYVSVPYRGNYFTMSFGLRLPKFSFFKEIVIAPNWFVNSKIDEDKIWKRVKASPEQFHSPHWWEVGMRGLSKKVFIQKMETYRIKLLDSYHQSIISLSSIFSF